MAPDLAARPATPIPAVFALSATDEADVVHLVADDVYTAALVCGTPLTALCGMVCTTTGDRGNAQCARCNAARSQARLLNQHAA
jgi:hypothetical protein